MTANAAINVSHNLRMTLSVSGYSDGAFLFRDISDGPVRRQHRPHSLRPPTLNPLSNVRLHRDAVESETQDRQACPARRTVRAADGKGVCRQTSRTNERACQDLRPLADAAISKGRGLSQFGSRPPAECEKGQIVRLNFN